MPPPRRPPGSRKTAGPGAAKGSPSAQLAGFIDKYDPSVAKLARAVRAAMRRRFPAPNELVYDNYQFLAIGYSSTERASDCLFSLAVSPKGVALSFYYGASLPDPKKVLLGSGNQNRFIRLESAATLSEPAVVTLMSAANAHAKTPLPAEGKGVTIIRSISAKQRPRRKAKA
ncbi:MAG: hypothetical protein ABI592_01345 [Acidobacteriota bacterium]